MVTVDQMKIKDISSTAVPFELPVCEIHNTLTTVVDTRKLPDDGKRRLSVRRMCRCSICHSLGMDDIELVTSRDF